MLMSETYMIKFMKSMIKQQSSSTMMQVMGKVWMIYACARHNLDFHRTLLTALNRKVMDKSSSRFYWYWTILCNWWKHRWNLFLFGLISTFLVDSNLTPQLPPSSTHCSKVGLLTTLKSIIDWFLDLLAHHPYTGPISLLFIFNSGKPYHPKFFSF